MKMKDASSLTDVIAFAFKNYSDNTAIIDKDKSISYRELEDNVSMVRNAIYNVTPAGKCIGICMQLSAKFLTCCLAVITCGCTYVPIDPAYPDERKKLILQDCECDLLIVDRDIHFEDLQVPILSYSSIKDKYSDSYQDTDIQAQNEIAYIIYTSGSKGKPKGVAVGHKAILNTLYWLKETFAIDSHDVIALKTTIGFTDSIIEIFLPVLCGAAIKVITENEIHDMEKLYHAMENVTIAQFVPPLLKMLVNYIKRNKIHNPLPMLRFILNGGQAIYMDLVRAVADIMPGTKIANTYGMTESAVYASCHILSPDDEEAYIGTAISNMQLLLMDEGKIITEPGIIGEICICGEGLMSYYVNDAELTDEKMPVDERLGRPVYHTGDLGKWSQNGLMAYCGRKDDQIKVNGKRVELNEMASVISGVLPDIISSVVAIPENDNNRIVCFLCGKDVDTAKLRKELQVYLPEYMIPTEFVYIDNMPLTVNGKIDQSKLISYWYSRCSSDKVRTVIENIWKSLLPDAEDINGDFFELGGDSLLAMKMVAMLEIVGYRVDYDNFRENATIQHLLEVISGEKGCTIHT